MSHTKMIRSPCAPSEEYSKSSSKRLFDSVFRILDHDDLEVSSFDNIDTNGSLVTTMLNSSSFLEALHLKIKDEQLLDTYPILKVQCKDSRGMLHPIDIKDLSDVFGSFCKLFNVFSSKNQLNYYVLYTNFSSAYVCMKLLNGFSLRHSFSQLIITWCPTQDYEQFSNFLQLYHSKVQWGIPDKESQKQNQPTNGQSKQCKLTCRYDIQINNEKEFQVARRIIGAKGMNMKKIIEGALDQCTEKVNSNQILKLRLRGKGSGYKEGIQQLESEEDLHLCISAKYESIYNHACESVENLLENIYLDYRDFTKKQGKEVTLTLRKSQLSSQNTPAAQTSSLKTIPMGNMANGRMDSSKIQQYLELRNKARRQLNFAEADRIRNYLRACGVCLIDEKGRRGKATEVTTWKYVI